MGYKPKKREIYAFTRERAGDFLLYVDREGDYYRFVYLPGGHFFNLSISDFEALIQNTTLDPFEQVPKEVFDETLNFALTGLSESSYCSSDNHETKQN